MPIELPASGFQPSQAKRQAERKRWRNEPTDKNIIEANVGFVYRIDIENPNIYDGNCYNYFGMKYFRFSSGKPNGPNQTRTQVSSDWKTYRGSSDAVKRMLRKRLNWEKTVLFIAPNSDLLQIVEILYIIANKRDPFNLNENIPSKTGDTFLPYKTSNCTDQVIQSALTYIKEIHKWQDYINRTDKYPNKALVRNLSNKICNDVNIRKRFTFNPDTK